MAFGWRTVTLGFGLLALAVLLAGTARAQGESRMIAFELRPGDTLWDIAREHLDLPSRWQDILSANGIEQAGRLRPGDQVQIDERWFDSSAMSLNVAELVGVVEIIRDGETSLLSPGSVAEPDRTVIQSHGNGRAKLVFGNGCTIVLAPDSVLVLDRVRYLGNELIPDIAVTLEAGNAEVAYPSTGVNRGSIDIRTRTAITSVRGTEFRVAFDADSAEAKSESLRGTIRFGNAQSEVELPTEFGSKAEIDRPPLPPVALPAPPATSGLPAIVTELPLELSLPPVEAAARYRFALHPEDQPLQLRGEQVAERPTFAIEHLDEGRYVLLARSIDDNGLAGVDSTHAFEVDARPRRPRLRQPVQEGRLLAPRPEFVWAVDESPLTFRLEIASDGDFAQPLHVAEDLLSARYSLPVDLPPGHYAWRVRAIDASGDIGQPSDVGRFRYQPPLPAVAVALALDADDRLQASWPSLAGASDYLVELAADADFGDIVRSRRSATPSADLGRPMPGPNYVRVTAFDEDGIAGETSAAVAFEPETPPWWQVIGIPAGLAVLLLLLL